MHPDLAITMEFEGRKQLAMQKRREQLRQQTLEMNVPNGPRNTAYASTSLPSPHKNRYNKAVAALSSSGPPVQPQEQAFQPGDPRGYLARAIATQANESPDAGAAERQPLKRRKTANMPFEKIPLDDTVHNLVQTIRTTQETLERNAAVIACCDFYVRSGTLSNGLDCTIQEARLWQTELQELLQRSLPRNEGDSAAKVQLDLWPILQQSHISAI